jgi:hypothetical protein
MLLLFYMRGYGCIERPVFPAPSFQREPNQRARLARKTCGEIAKPCLIVICEPTGRANARPTTGLREAIQLFGGYSDCEKVDCFVASLLAMTADLALENGDATPLHINYSPAACAFS